MTNCYPQILGYSNLPIIANPRHIYLEPYGAVGYRTQGLLDPVSKLSSASSLQGRPITHAEFHTAGNLHLGTSDGHISD